MKLRGDDGVVRTFVPARVDGELVKGKRVDGYHDSMCVECGEEFGVHDLKVLKPRWRKHACKVGVSRVVR